MSQWESTPLVVDSMLWFKQLFVSTFLPRSSARRQFINLSDRSNQSSPPQRHEMYKYKSSYSQKDLHCKKNLCRNWPPRTDDSWWLSYSHLQGDRAVRLRIANCKGASVPGGLLLSTFPSSSNFHSLKPSWTQSKPLNVRRSVKTSLRGLGNLVAEILRHVEIARVILET